MPLTLAPEPTATAMNPAARHVLVVDDDPDIRALLDFSLSRSGLAVTTAASGHAGLAAAAEERPDLIVLDVMMPGMSGLLVCDHLRRNAATMETPILLLSAAPTETHVAWGLQAGASGFLAKPVSPALLSEHIHRLLDGGPAPAPAPWSW